VELSDYEKRKAVTILERIDAVVDVIYSDMPTTAELGAAFEALADAAGLLDKFCRMYGINHNWKGNDHDIRRSVRAICCPLCGQTQIRPGKEILEKRPDQSPNARPSPRSDG
jgi:hypothetical protein